MDRINSQVLPAFITILPFRESTIFYHKRKYTAGDAIRGLVRVDPQCRPRRIFLNFKGRTTYTSFHSSSSSTDTIPETCMLFEHTLALFQSANPERSYDILGLGMGPDGKRVDIPFEFKFPQTVELPASKFTWAQAYECRPGHPLPPSHELRKGYGAEAKNEYFLELIMHTTSKSDKVHHADLKAKQKLYFISPSPSPSYGLDGTGAEDFIRYTPRDTQFKTYRLDPDYDPHKSILKRWKDHREKHAPHQLHATFSIKANIPRSAVSKGLLPITLHLRNVSRSPELRDPPTVHLRCISVMLSSKLCTRTPRPRWDRSPNAGDQTEYKYDSQANHRNIFERAFDTGDGVVLYDGLKVQELGNVRVPELTPTFKTYGVNLNYTIFVRVLVECAGEKRGAIACHGEVEIGSGVAPVEDVDGALEELERGDTAPAEGDLPPPYEERERDVRIEVGEG
ncbi:hypothetical protein EJ04DRAFT_590431 [Polyplosphaeria fusca]|uniref:Uncharacterized protein n=1 Tax=Polyplosphaeria fusca TaxID=682080 RepID=A0A9P4R679_9PLEO|nr:hypothetical protein EJ04DRAFT_590431 [Polyplosphaeria fusca]